MFDNIENKIKRAPTQKGTGGKVAAKKAGRPPKPNMKKYIFKVDELQHAKLVKKAQNIGMNKSAVINMLIHRWLSN